MIFFAIVNYTLKDFMEKHKLSFSLRIVHTFIITAYTHYMFSYASKFVNHVHMQHAL